MIKIVWWIICAFWDVFIRTKRGSTPREEGGNGECFFCTQWFLTHVWRRLMAQVRETSFKYHIKDTGFPSQPLNLATDLSTLWDWKIYIYPQFLLLPCRSLSVKHLQYSVHRGKQAAARRNWPSGNLGTHQEWSFINGSDSKSDI